MSQKPDFDIFGAPHRIVYETAVTPQRDRTPLVALRKHSRWVSGLLAVVTAIHFGYTHWPASQAVAEAQATTPAHVHHADRLAVTGKLYLIEKIAPEYRHDFEARVREIADFHQFAPEWLMAVMFNESRLDHTARNQKGSGATGLIQWMPNVAQSFGVSTDQLAAMSPLEQLDYVEQYFARHIERKGDLKTFTDLYMSVLWPKGAGQSNDFILYRKPSKAYRQNAGLDQNKDGRVTKGDVAVLLQKRYPTAAAVEFKP